MDTLVLISLAMAVFCIGGVVFQLIRTYAEE